MITVTKLEKRPGAKPAVVAIEEGKDPFEVCAAVARLLGKRTINPDPEFEAVMRARSERPAQKERSLETGGMRIPQGWSKADVDEALSSEGRRTRQESREAFRDGRTSGAFTAQQKRLLAHMRSIVGDRTRSELAKELKLENNVLTARVHELLYEVSPAALREVSKRRCRITRRVVNALVLA